MTTLASDVVIDRRFARSTRLDADLNGAQSLTGYVLQASIARALTTMAESQIESQQGAFTWTGPYGGGKSSAALLLANLVAGTKANRKQARKIAGPALSDLFGKAFPEKNGDWNIVAVTGSRARLRDKILEAAAATFDWAQHERAQFSETDHSLITALHESGTENGSGTLLILDELGKMLEHEALEGGDVHLLQDIAEYASRSNGQLVVIGILHQSFEQYAARASRDARQEWAKVQGRYQDIAFLSGADEVIALLGRAIQCTPPASAYSQAKAVAEVIAKQRPTEVDALASALAKTWPLNPVTSMLLGPVSRARFAQNERSVFGFLCSAEPAGFQDFLNKAENSNETYTPAMLWDYLAANFGLALASGVDGNKYSLAFEAIERAGAKGETCHVALTKAAVVIELFRSGSGLALTDEILSAALPTIDDATRTAAIEDLINWAILIRQPRLGGYALFSGSDFDLEDAIERSIAPLDNRQLEEIPQRIGLGFAAAKRHYFLTGALRTFEIALHIISAEDSPRDTASSLMSRAERGSGLLVLLLSDGSLKPAEITKFAKAAAAELNRNGRVIAIGAATDSYDLRSTAAELIAVEHVSRNHPQLEGDRIARREIAARQSFCIGELQRHVETSLGTAHWYLAPSPTKGIRGTLSIVASALADAGYPRSPILKSELLQRDKPSSSAMAALRDLAYAMVNHASEENLGIKGFPAELGLYLTLLKPFGLHRPTPLGTFAFAPPDDSAAGQSLQPAWDLIDTAGAEGLDKVFSLWAAPPYGLKAGIMPILVLAYMLAKRESVAVYIDGMYQTALNDVVVDKLLQNPRAFRLRRIDRSVRETAFLSTLGECLGVEVQEGSLPVAAKLFQRYEALPAYAQRTNRLDDDARLVRSIVLKAVDPEALLFEALPKAFGERLSADLVYNALLACEACYGALLSELQQALARALGVDAASFGGISERVQVIKGLTNDYAFDAFADRAAAIEQGTGDIESLVSVLLHRPARNWSDRDREEALTEVARFGKRFRELEALAAVRNRQSNTQALALVVGLDANMPPLMRSFALSKKEEQAAKGLANRIVSDLRTSNKNGRLQLAALAQAVAELIGDTKEDEEAA